MTATSSWSTVTAALERAGVLPVATVDDADQAVAAARALTAAGLRCVEIALRTPAALDAIERLRDVDGVAVGAGTVSSTEQARAAAEAGATFAVAPCLDEDVASACGELGLPFIPGVATPSEIHRAERLGFGVVKLFPAAQIGGAAFVRAVSATFPRMRFLPTGGIDASSLQSFLDLPSVLACGGSWMVAPELLRSGRFDEVERLARNARKSTR